MALSNKIPKGWEKVQLEEVAKIKINSINPQKLGSEKFLLFSYPAYDRNKTPELTEGKNIKSNKLLLEEKCILFPKLNPSTPRIWYIKKFDEGYRRVSSTEFFPITPYSNNVNFNYLYYYLKTPSFYNLVAQWTTGTSGSHQRISKKSLLTAEILLPPLPEQRAIASVLSSLDDKIDLLHRQNKTLEAMAETLFRKWFIEDAKEDWEEGKLGDFITPKKGKNLTKAQAKGGIYPVIAGGIAPSCYHNEANTKAPVITISASGANAGYVQLHHIPVWSSDSSYIDYTVTPFVYFYYLFLKINQDKIYDKQEGSAQPHIYPSHLMDLDILDYPEILVRDFENVCLELFKKVKNNQQQIRTLEKLRDTLLPKLMSGEVRVRV